MNLRAHRIKKTVGATTTFYPFGHYEVSGTAVTKYYFFGSQRIAMRKGTALTYLHTDHLGGTVLETNASGTITTDQKYFAYGKQRDTGPVVTDHRFTGQKQDGSGLVYMNARYYDPLVGMFISPDTIVPDAGVLIDYNRYAYGRANPLKFNDPTGHCVGAVGEFGHEAGCTPAAGEEGSYKTPTINEIQLALDIVGTLDPSPLSDGANSLISLSRGNYADAGLSTIAMIPYLGDLAKGAKYGDEIAAAAKYADNVPCVNSFSADTLVMTASGSKPIADLVIGDIVLAYNEAAGKIEPHSITDTISHIDPEIVLLTIDGELLETTAEHPFYVMDSAPWLAAGQTAGRWIDAGELTAGDDVRRADGSTGAVESVEVVAVEQRMYNLKVDVAHTFFVGHGAWLVHNECLPSWTPHGFKHFAQKSLPWNDVVKSTKNGPAKYAPDIDIETLERAVWEAGVPVTNGRSWKVADLGQTIGASAGRESQWIRVEYSGGTIHGHPITQQEFYKLLK